MLCGYPFKMRSTLFWSKLSQEFPMPLFATYTAYLTHLFFFFYHFFQELEGGIISADPPKVYHALIFCTSTFNLTFLPFRLLCLGQNCPLKKYAQGVLQEENAGKSTKSADWI